MTSEAASVEEHCQHPRGDLEVRCWQEPAGGQVQELVCKACQVPLVRTTQAPEAGAANTEAAGEEAAGCGGGGATVVSVGDEQWYITEVAYLSPKDAIKDGVPYVKVEN